MSLSDNLNLFQRCRVAKHKLCTYGAGMAKSRWSLDMTGYQPTDLSRLDFRRLPGPVFDPPSFGGWVRAHFPEQRLVIEPTTYRDQFFLARARKSPKNRHSIHYSSSFREKHLIGDIAMVIVKFRPRWPHTWRYALHSLSRPTMTSGRLG